MIVKVTATTARGGITLCRGQLVAGNSLLNGSPGTRSTSQDLIITDLALFSQLAVDMPEVGKIRRGFPARPGEWPNSNDVPALLLNRRFQRQRRLPVVARAAASGLRGG
jgi:hypothetical protein